MFVAASAAERVRARKNVTCVRGYCTSNSISSSWWRQYARRHHQYFDVEIRLVSEAINQPISNSLMKRIYVSFLSQTCSSFLAPLLSSRAMRSFLYLALFALPRVLAHSSSAARSWHHGSRNDKPVATAWYAGWHADEGFPLEAVPWSKYTQLTYAFA